MDGPVAKDPAIDHSNHSDLLEDISRDKKGLAALANHLSNTDPNDQELLVSLADAEEFWKFLENEERHMSLALSGQANSSAELISDSNSTSPSTNNDKSSTLSPITSTTVTAAATTTNFDAESPPRWRHKEKQVFFNLLPICLARNDWTPIVNGISALYGRTDWHKSWDQVDLYCKRLKYASTTNIPAQVTSTAARTPSSRPISVSTKHPSNTHHVEHQESIEASVEECNQEDVLAQLACRLEEIKARRAQKAALYTSSSKNVRYKLYHHERIANLVKL